MDKFFAITKKGSTVRTEIIAGFTTFLAMAYILPVNAFMLSKTGMPVAAVFVATAVSAAIATLIMGLYANYPVALAPGMGVNAFFTFTVVFSWGYTWQQALSLVFISGVIFLVISLTGLRKKVINAIPMNLKYAVGAGIGFFITFIGLKNAGIVVSNPATFVALGELTHPAVLLALFGLIITVVLYARGVKSSVFVGIAVTAVVGLLLGVAGVEYMPAFQEGNLGELSAITETFGAAFDGIVPLLTDPKAWIAVFTFLFVDFFDTAGTLMAVGQKADLINENGELVDAEKALAADAVGTVCGAVLGTSTVTSFVESTTGVEAGGRTGLTATVVGILFILSLFAYPLLSLVNGVVVGFDGFGDAIVYSPVTAPALIMVGALMVTSLKNIEWDDAAVSITTFFTIIFMVLSFSIAEGIAVGFVFYPLLKLVTGKGKDVNYIMYILAVVFTFFLLFVK